MKKNNDKIVFIAGGGTGGHLFPALAIGESLDNNGIIVQYIGSKFGVEKKLFNKLKLNYCLLNIKGIQRHISIRSLITNITFPFLFILSYIHSIKLILKYKPLIIIGTGGYCSGLPLLAGITLNIPTLIQDQNSVPGLITRKLNNKVNKICLSYKISNKYLNNFNCIITGNPIRKTIKHLDKKEAIKFFNFNINKKTILILGGSQGSQPINTHISKNIQFYLKSDLQIIWQCGENNFKKISSNISNKNIIIKKFIDNISAAYSAADIVISRAGAISISELMFMKKAMILIPYPYAAENHQKINSDYFEKRDACIAISEDKLYTGVLEKTINKLINNPEIIKDLEFISEKFSFPNATHEIKKQIMEIIN